MSGAASPPQHSRRMPPEPNLPRPAEPDPREEITRDLALLKRLL